MKNNINFFKLISVIILMCSLTACGFGGGVYVNMGSHEQQDEVMYEELKKKYPKAEFQCISSEIRNVHNVKASDETEFTVWVMALRKNEWQIQEHYAEDWLIKKGWYEAITKQIEEAGMHTEFYTSNYYPHNFRIQCGELTEETLDIVMKAVYKAKDEFDECMTEFMENTGADELPYVDILVKFTKNGESKSQYLPMGATNSFSKYHGPYDYERYFDYYMDMEPQETGQNQQE